MLRFAALAIVLVVAACSPVPAAPSTSSSPTTADPTTTTTIPSPTTTIPSPTTTIPSPTTTIPSTTSTTRPDLLLLELAPAEMAALRQKRTSIVVTSADGSILGEFEASRALLPIAVVPPALLSFTYAFADAPGDVSWTQEVIRTGPLLVSQPWRDEQPGTGEIALAWLANGTTAEYLVQLDRSGINVAAPVCWFIRADGSLSDTCDGAFVAGAHDRGIAVWVTIAGLDADANHLAFATPETWEAMARRISERGRALGADGINVDIEGYRHEDAAAVASFLSLLTELVHEWGGVTSYDLIPRTDEWQITPEELAFWSDAPLRREIAGAVDYVVLMAYDEFNRYRPAGPVASPPWVEANLHYLLRYADASRIVLGVPFYARIWDPDRLDAPRAVGIGRIPDLAAEAVEAVSDPAMGVDRVTLADGRFFWTETPAGLQHRIDLVAEYGLAGWAAWRLGFDSAAIWEVVGDPQKVGDP
jgi:spore germination protein YaaH